MTLFKYMCKILEFNHFILKRNGPSRELKGLYYITLSEVEPQILGWPKSPLGFSKPPYGETQMNFFDQPSRIKVLRIQVQPFLHISWHSIIYVFLGNHF